MIESSKEWIFLGDAIWLIASNGEESPSPEFIESNWDRAARALFDAIDGRETEAEPQGYHASDRVHVPLPTGIWHRMNGDNELKDPFFTPLDPEEKRETRGMISIHGNGKWYGCRLRRAFVDQVLALTAGAAQRGEVEGISRLLQDPSVKLEPMVRDILTAWTMIFAGGSPAKAASRNKRIFDHFHGQTISEKTIQKAVRVLRDNGLLPPAK